ncbi:hypothetical protein ACTPEU_20270, partial [Clostridioides difficile]
FFIHSKDEVEEAVRKGLEVDEFVMIEKYIPGGEYTSFILNGEAKKAFSIPKACSVPVSLGNKLWLLTTKNPTDSKKSEPDRA